MSRDPLQTVTLPLLIDEEERADGECAVFPKQGGQRLTKVRVISPDTLKRWLERNTRSGLARALNGLSLLRRAYTEKDTRALLAAVEQTRPLIPKTSFGTVTEDWSGEKMWDGARWHYSEAMSHAVKNARWVVWWPFSGQHEPTPGLYCPDMSTAAAVALFVESVRVCPHCGVAFVPPQNNIGYCKPAHGVAHRTATSRDKAKQAEALVRANPKLSTQKLIRNDRSRSGH